MIFILLHLSLPYTGYQGTFASVSSEPDKTTLKYNNITNKSSSGEEDVKESDHPPEYFYLRIRLGQGGYRDDRSPIGKLGGGQLALDIIPVSLPLAFSLTQEYYTNSAEPTHNYEIAVLLGISLNL